MSRFAMFAAAAAVIVVAALVGLRFLPSDSGIGVGGQPTASPAPTTEATSPEPSVARPTSTPGPGLPEGPFSFEPDGPFSSEDSGMTLTVTIPASGWTFERPWNLLQKGPERVNVTIGFWAFPGEEFYVPADPCRATSTKPDTPATTVDEIAAALAAQASRNASEPVDVMIGGYAGKSLILHVPEDVRLTTCEAGEFITYFTGMKPDPFYRNIQSLDEVSELWILDVDGTTVIIDALIANTPAELVEEMRAIAESATFETP